MRLIRCSIRNVLRSPLRLILVVTLLGASLMFVAVMVSLDSSAQQELATVRQQIGNTISIEYVPAQNSKPGGGTPTTTLPGSGTSISVSPPGIPNSMVAKIKKTPGVVATEERIARPYTEQNLDSVPGAPLIMINGISEGASDFALSGGVVPTLVAGRAFQDSDANADVAMMSQALARQNHLQIGSTFFLNGTLFTLIGLYTTSSQIEDSTLIIPLTVLQQVYHLDGVDSVTVTAASLQQVDTVAARLRALLGVNFSVTAQADQYNNVFGALQIAQNTIKIALVASFLIAAAVIVFAVLMLERTAEIAILKTIGASRLQVLRQFWAEIMVLSALAAALALLLIMSLGSWLAHLFDIDASALVNADSGGNHPSFDHPISINGGVISSTTPTTASNLNTIHLAAATLNIQTFLIIVGVGIGLALLTSFIPTWFITHLKPAEILRKAN